jgi:hypothetical protein
MPLLILGIVIILAGLLVSWRASRIDARTQGRLFLLPARWTGVLLIVLGGIAVLGSLAGMFWG